MRAPFTVTAVILLVLALVPGWTVEERLRLLQPDGQMEATRVDLDPRDPTRTRVGGLTYLGGVALSSRDPAFGGFSALAVDGDRFTLLADGGNIVRFRMGGDWRPRDIAFSALPGGPGIGWDKRDRDSESLTVDPVSGRLFVGFENANAIWRYAPGFARAEAMARPSPMRGWTDSGGPEAFARLPDGRFVAISESLPTPRRAWRSGERARRRTRDAIVFSGDPTTPGTRQARFAYQPARGYSPTGAAALPGGDLVVLDRDFSLPFIWSNRISIVPSSAIRAGVAASGRPIATLGAPLLHDNFEGVAVTREGRDTMLWLVSDNNQSLLQRSLLLKFRLER